MKIANILIISSDKNVCKHKLNIADIKAKFLLGIVFDVMK